MRVERPYTQAAERQQHPTPAHPRWADQEGANVREGRRRGSDTRASSGPQSTEEGWRRY